MIAIVDDDKSVCAATASLLRSAGYEIQTFDSAEQFMASAPLSQMDCAIVDIRMPGMDGVELQRRLAAGRLDLPLIFITAHDDGPVRQRVMNGGAIAFFRKPFEAEALLASVRDALSRVQGETPGSGSASQQHD